MTGLAGFLARLGSAGDTAGSKLEWARRSGGSERQLRDARGVLERDPDLQVDCVARRVRELGLADLWQSLRDALR